MKRNIVVVLSLFIAVVLLGCTENHRMDITREEIIAAYENAGYLVSSRMYDEKLDYGQTGYIQANHPDGGYVYFLFFETPEQAQAYKEEFYHPVAMGLFAVLFGEPSWQRWEVCESLVIQYDQPDFYEPFKQLLEGS